MKICKNQFDVIIFHVDKCYQCALRTRRSPCLWIKVVGTKLAWPCGGVIQDTISDIFKL